MEPVVVIRYKRIESWTIEQADAFYTELYRLVGSFSKAGYSHVVLLKDDEWHEGPKIEIYRRPNWLVEVINALRGKT